MSGTKVQLNYDELQLIAKNFRQESEDVAQLRSSTRQKMNALRHVWAGRAAETFFNEMDGRVLPGLERVSRALMDAEITLIRIMGIIHNADEETIGYFKGFDTSIAVQPGQKYDWLKLIDGITGTPGVKPLVSIPIGVISDLKEGDNWGRAIFSEVAESVIDMGASALFPPYMAYPLVISWMHMASAESQLFGHAVSPSAPLADGIFEVAKFFDPTLTEADQSVWFQNTAEWLDVREEAGDWVYDTAKYFVDHTKMIGPLFYFDFGPNSPFNILPSQQMPVAL